MTDLKHAIFMRLDDLRVNIPNNLNLELKTISLRLNSLNGCIYNTRSDDHTFHFWKGLLKRISKQLLWMGAHKFGPVYFNIELQSSLVKCEDHTFNTSFANFLSIVLNFIVPSLLQQLLHVRVLFDLIYPIFCY